MDQKIAREKQIRRGEKTLRLLEALSHGALLVGELCMALSPAYSNAQARKIKKRKASVSEFFAEERDQRRFYSLLTHMQNAGLVEKGRIEGAASWRITAEGREKKTAIKISHAKMKTPRIPSSTYPIKRNDKLVIVIFDIPEKERNKRIWIRNALISMKFALVQKSVWMGNIQLPTAFIADLKQYDILRHVKIFSATELGNMYE